MKKNDELNDVYIKFFPEKEEEINEFLNNIKNFGEIFFDEYFRLSSILNNNMLQQKLIINWIEEKTNKKLVKLKLIFKMSENGSKSQDFHKYCDNKGPTVIIVKTTKNKIFGGFTPLNWQVFGEIINDSSNQTFIFSLNLNKKYDMINKGGKGIYCIGTSGPNFGASDFRLNSDMKRGTTYANNCCNFLSNNNLELTGGKGESESFEVEEFEVYKVLL